ncbi:MAG: AraC family transcriptional regulator [Bacteroidetes bacterium]|nr:MAG: AraC family transcriptional regulator [Bacteroidota bacterium]
MISSISERKVKSIFETMGLQISVVAEGEIELLSPINVEQLAQIQSELLPDDFEILFDKKAILTERVKHLIIRMVYNDEEMPIINYSEYISRKMCVNYTFLSKSFSRAWGITIEQYIITQKIERVKQLISEDELSIADIASTMKYSSPAHLSTQFKRITGISPSDYRKNTRIDSQR